MQKKELAKYKKMLLSEKRSLKEELKTFTDDEKMSQKESTGELSSYDNHPGDDGTTTARREISQGVKDNVISLLKQVEDSLNKIEVGNYGICQNCGDEIKEDRLEVVPYTSFCEKCKETGEAIDGERKRPLAEYAYFPPFGRGFTDGTSKIEYDAEDSWQDVAQYGTSAGPIYSPDALDGDNPSKESYLDSDEVVGSVGIEDSIIDDDVDTVEESDDMKTTFTGRKGEDKR